MSAMHDHPSAQLFNSVFLTSVDFFPQLGVAFLRRLFHRTLFRIFLSGVFLLPSRFSPYLMNYPYMAQYPYVLSLEIPHNFSWCSTFLHYCLSNVLNQSERLTYCKHCFDSSWPKNNHSSFYRITSNFLLFQYSYLFLSLRLYLLCRLSPQQATACGAYQFKEVLGRENPPRYGYATCVPQHQHQSQHSWWSNRSICVI